MSGCFISSTHAARRRRSAAASTARRSVLSRSGRAASSCAAKRTSDSLSSSDGWNWSGPGAEPARRAVHRHADAGQHHATPSATNEPPAATAVSALTTFSPWREEVQHHQPDEPEDHVALQVVRRVARAVEQRLRRARRVDHDRAEREQAERRRVDRRVLDGVVSPSLLRAASRHPGFLRRPAPNSSSRRPTNWRKWAPRASKSSYWSKLAQAGESSTTSPGAAAPRRGVDGVLEVAAAVQRRRSRRGRRPARPRLADQVAAPGSARRRVAQRLEAAALQAAAGDQRGRRRRTPRARAAPRRRWSPSSR